MATVPVSQERQVAVRAVGSIGLSPISNAQGMNNFGRNLVQAGSAMKQANDEEEARTDKLMIDEADTNLVAELDKIGEEYRMLEGKAAWEGQKKYQDDINQAIKLNASTLTPRQRQQNKRRSDARGIGAAKVGFNHAKAGKDVWEESTFKNKLLANTDSAKSNPTASNVAKNVILTMEDVKARVMQKTGDSDIAADEARRAASGLVTEVAMSQIADGDLAAADATIALLDELPQKLGLEGSMLTADDKQKWKKVRKDVGRDYEVSAAVDKHYDEDLNSKEIYDLATKNVKDPKTKNGIRLKIAENKALERSAELENKQEWHKEWSKQNDPSNGVLNTKTIEQLMRENPDWRDYMDDTDIASLKRQQQAHYSKEFPQTDQATIDYIEGLQRSDAALLGIRNPKKYDQWLDKQDYAEFELAWYQARGRLPIGVKDTEAMPVPRTNQQVKDGITAMKSMYSESTGSNVSSTPPEMITSFHREINRLVKRHMQENQNQVPDELAMGDMVGDLLQEYLVTEEDNNWFSKDIPEHSVFMFELLAGDVEKPEDDKEFLDQYAISEVKKEAKKRGITLTAEQLTIATGRYMKQNSEQIFDKWIGMLDERTKKADD